MLVFDDCFSMILSFRSFFCALRPVPIQRRINCQVVLATAMAWREFDKDGWFRDKASNSLQCDRRGCSSAAGRAQARHRRGFERAQGIRLRLCGRSNYWQVGGMKVQPGGHN